MRRFSLKQLLLAIAVFGLLLASLRFAAPFPARALFDVVLLLLSFSVLLAIYSHEPRRAFWTGFALFGWVMLAATQFHVLFATFPQSGPIPPKWVFHPLAQDNLPTTIVGRGLYRELRPVLVIAPPPPPPGWLITGPMRDVLANQNSVMQQASDGTILASGPGPFYIVEDDFLAVADCWWILLSGAVGGLTARWLSGRRNKRETGSANTVIPGS